jgi:hypothetical protein
MAIGLKRSRQGDSAVQDLDDLQASSREVRRRFEEGWFLNLAFHEGKQWVAFDGRQLFEPELDPNMERRVNNKIRPAIRKEIAKITKQRPTWVGTPRDGSDDEISRARLREQIFEHEWRELNLTRKRRAALLWARTTGAGFWKIYWDATLGKGVDVLAGQDGKPIKNGYGAPIKADMLDQLPEELGANVTTKRINMGDVCVEVRSPFQIFPDPLATEDGLESAEWLIEECVYSEEYVKTRYGVELEPNATAQAGIVESRFPGFAGFGSLAGAGRKNGVKLRELWATRSSTFPRGRYVVWGDDEVLYEDDNPYPWLNYAMFRGVVEPGRFWPSSPIDDARDPQVRINKRESQVDNNADRIGNPPFLNPVTSDVEWHNLPGEEIQFTPTGGPDSQPRFMEVPELPGYIREDIPRQDNSLADIFGQHEVTNATVPTGVTAASAINLLQEADDSLLGPDIEDIEESIRDAGRRLLWILRNFASDERIARIAGDDSAWDIFAWRGDQLGEGDNDGVAAGSLLPQSKAAKQAAIQQVLTLFVQNAIPIGERELRGVFRAMEVGGLENFFASVSRDERQVNDENRRLLQGEQFAINSYDNDSVHVAGHEDMQKSSRYQEAIGRAGGQQIAAGVEAHVQAHRDRIAAKQMQPPPPGGPPGSGPGGPGQPPTGPPSGPDGEAPAPPSTPSPFAQQ